MSARVLAIAVLVVAARRSPPAAARRPRRGHGDAEPLTLALDFYVNPDHAGIYTALDRGYFDEAGLEVDPEVPSDPRRRSARSPPAAPTSRSPTSPRCCSPRTRGCRSSPSRALVDRPLTSLISLPEAGIGDVARPVGQDDRHRGDPVPGRLPRRDPRRRGPLDPAT